MEGYTFSLQLDFTCTLIIGSLASVVPQIFQYFLQLCKNKVCEGCLFISELVRNSSDAALLNYYCHLKCFYFRVAGIFLGIFSQTEPHSAAPRASVWEWQDEKRLLASY